MSLSVEQLTKPLKVARRIQETSDAVSFVFEIPPERKTDFHYQAGQFVTLFLDLGGEPLKRSYSLCSSPLVDSEFKITVKKVPGGRGSTYLCDQVKVGQVLNVTPPAGHFFKPNMAATEYFLFAAGSGITPTFSILKTVLNASQENRVHLLFCNRNEESIIYAQELKQLSEKFQGRLSIVHLLTQPAANWSGEQGRCTPATIAKFIQSASKLHKEYYICGPDGFMNVVRDGLHALSIPREAIREENFAIGIDTTQKAPTLKSEWTYIGDRDQAQENSGGHIVAMVQGELVECDAKPDQSILEALIEAGANPPYSCMDGACMACLCKVQEGLVYQKDPGILADENIENRETLTCQARVLSRNVKISYDAI